MKFNELPEGAYFTWKGSTYRKVPGGNAIEQDSDVIMAFRSGNECTIVEKPKRRIDLVIQYLDWALIQAHVEAHPDARNAIVRLDLKRKQSTTEVN